MPFISFSCLSALPRMVQSIKCWVEVLRIDIFVSFLVLGEKHSVFHREGHSCEFFVDVLNQVKELPFLSLCECFYLWRAVEIMHILVHYLCWVHMKHALLLCTYQEVEMLNHWVCLSLAFIDTVKQFLKVLLLVNTSTNIIWGFQLLSGTVLH